MGEKIAKDIDFLACFLFCIYPRHAKRTTVSSDDVKMCCRRNPDLLEFISKQAEKQKADRDAATAAKKRGRKKQVEEDEPLVAVEDEPPVAIEDEEYDD